MTSARSDNRRITFWLLILAQAAHSIEEYVGRLYDVFPPARVVSGLISADRERGFAIFNVALVGFGLWCLYRPVRRGWRSAVTFGWLWVGIEPVNGVGHPLWSLRERAYTPGVATAPVLLILALSLASELRSAPRWSRTASKPRPRSDDRFAGALAHDGQSHAVESPAALSGRIVAVTRGSAASRGLMMRLNSPRVGRRLFRGRL